VAGSDQWISQQLTWNHSATSPNPITVSIESLEPKTRYTLRLAMLFPDADELFTWPSEGGFTFETIGLSNVSSSSSNSKTSGMLTRSLYRRSSFSSGNSSHSVPASRCLPSDVEEATRKRFAHFGVLFRRLQESNVERKRHRRDREQHHRDRTPVGDALQRNR